MTRTHLCTRQTNMSNDFAAVADLTVECVDPNQLCELAKEDPTSGGTLECTRYHILEQSPMEANGFRRSSSCVPLAMMAIQPGETTPPPITGCMDPLADNYDPMANLNMDCEYPDKNMTAAEQARDPTGYCTKKRDADRGVQREYASLEMLYRGRDDLYRRELLECLPRRHWSCSCNELSESLAPAHLPA